MYVLSDLDYVHGIFFVCVCGVYTRVGMQRQEDSILFPGDRVSH